MDRTLLYCILDLQPRIWGAAAAAAAAAMVKIVRRLTPPGPKVTDARIRMVSNSQLRCARLPFRTVTSTTPRKLPPYFDFIYQFYFQLFIFSGSLGSSLTDPRGRKKVASLLTSVRTTHTTHSHPRPPIHPSIRHAHTSLTRGSACGVHPRSQGSPFVSTSTPLSKQNLERCWMDPDLAGRFECDDVTM